jgi:hypothetical protein
VSLIYIYKFKRSGYDIKIFRSEEGGCCLQTLMCRKTVYLRKIQKCKDLRRMNVVYKL